MLACAVEPTCKRGGNERECSRDHFLFWSARVDTEDVSYQYITFVFPGDSTEAAPLPSPCAFLSGCEECRFGLSRARTCVMHPDHLLRRFAARCCALLSCCASPSSGCLMPPLRPADPAAPISCSLLFTALLLYLTPLPPTAPAAAPPSSSLHLPGACRGLFTVADSPAKLSSWFSRGTRTRVGRRRLSRASSGERTRLSSTRRPRSDEHRVSWRASLRRFGADPIDVSQYL